MLLFAKDIQREDMQTLGYSRQSRAVAEESLENRRQQVETIAAQHNLTIGVWIEENAESSTDSERAGLKRLEEMIISGQVRTVVMTERSRLGRGDPEYWGRLTKLFKLYGICLISRDGVQDYAKRGVSTLAPEIIDAVNREQKRQYSERVKSAGAERLKNGKPGVGPAPFGYRHDRGAPGGYGIVPDEYAVLQEILHRTPTESLYAIMRDFNLRGVPTPGRSALWTHVALRSIAGNPFYAGYRRQRFEVFDEMLFRLPEPILSEKQGEWCCPITLADHYRLTAVLGKKIHFGEGGMALLRGLVLCPAGQSMRGEGGEYGCACYQNGRGHPGSSVARSRLEEWACCVVWQRIVTLSVPLQGEFSIEPSATGYKEARAAFDAARRELQGAQGMSSIQRGFMGEERYQEMLRHVERIAASAREEMERLQAQITAPDVSRMRDMAAVARACGEAVWMDPTRRTERVQEYNAILGGFIRSIRLRPYSPGQKLHTQGEPPAVEWHDWCKRGTRRLPPWPQRVRNGVKR